MMVDENNSYKRETAKYVKIEEINNSEYVKQEGWNPNYLDTAFGNVSRVNIFGVITIKEPRRLVIDDSTGEIEIRSFEEIICPAEIGETINVIGRPREFNERIYIMPEIVKKIDNEHFIEFIKLKLNSRKKIKDVKKVERKPIDNQSSVQQFTPKSIQEQQPTQENVVEEDIVIQDEIVLDNNSEPQTILDQINEMDEGDGVYVDEIIAKLKIEDCEKKLNRLLEKGDIFEVKPGKVKVL